MSDSLIFPDTLQSDLNKMIIGEKLGSGQFRGVFVCAYDDTKVVKLEEAGTFHNVSEWDTWEEVQQTKWAKWFAPCYHISPCGRVLIQARTKPITRRQMPLQVPAFFTDMHSGNWGRYKGHPVMHDYGYTQLKARGMSSAMRTMDFSRWD